MAPPLPEELVEEILLRFPPDDPARLVQASLVCKRWCAIVSGAGFRRRFGKFHRAPPLLGFVPNFVARIQRDRGAVVEFVPTCSLPASRIRSGMGHVRVVDAHHGRVLFHRISASCGLPRDDLLMVWDPTTDMQEEVPTPDVLCQRQYKLDWTAAVLPCDRLDCRPGPFLIVFVGYDWRQVETVLCTYSSSTASWSRPISSNQLQFPYRRYMFSHVAHVESALYFGLLPSDHILKFDLESQEISWIQMPPTGSSNWNYVLTTTEDGRLGLATIHEFSRLYMWSRDDVSQVDATWTQSRVIELNTLLPVHAVLSSPRVFGLTVGNGVIFVRSNNVLFAIDLKTYKVIIKEVPMANEIYTIVPYMSFYTPVALGAISTSEAP